MSLISEKSNNENDSLANKNILEEEKENDNGNIKDAQHITPEMVLRLPTITDSMLTALLCDGLCLYCMGLFLC